VVLLDQPLVELAVRELAERASDREFAGLTGTAVVTESSASRVSSSGGCTGGILVFSEGFRPSDFAKASVARRFAGALRSPGWSRCPRAGL
jgi:hypothetical protein